MEQLITNLNAVLRGWAQYHKYVVSSETFFHVDKYVFDRLWQMLHRRHPNKSKGWLTTKYWTAFGKKWVFSITRTYKKKVYVSHVLSLSSIGTKRYIKIKADANPYLRKYRGYFWERRHKKDAKFRNQIPARET